MALMPTQVLFPNGSEDDNLIADIDWATGIVRMHMTLPEWHRLVEADRTELSDRSRFTLEVLTHEALHLLHIVTTGYAYEFAVRLSAMVVKALEEEGDLDGVYR